MSQTVILLLLKSLQPYTGNYSTVKRIQSYFSPPRFKCIVAGANTWSTADKFHEFLIQEDVNFVLGIHAYHAGRLLNQSPVPYAIIFGGTDLNVFCNDTDRFNLMTNIVCEAKCLVVFNYALEKKARILWSGHNMAKFVPIPQAVEVEPSEFNIFNHVRKYYYADNFTKAHSCIFTLIAGIREVKDPLFLIETFTKWHQCNPNVFLLIIGPPIEIEFAKKFQLVIKNKPGILYCSGLQQQHVHAVIRDSFAVVNSSISEGMSTALLEAMALETLVIARDNLGNRSLIEHGKNGLLFTSPSDFITCAEQALFNMVYKRSMVAKAKCLVEQNHNCLTEQEKYHAIVKDSLRAFKKSLSS